MELHRRTTLPDVLANLSGRWSTSRLADPLPSRSQTHHQSVAGNLSPKTEGFKVVLIGDSNVGKTSIMLRLTRGKFYEIAEATLGTAFSVYEVIVDESVVKLDIWDTAGQEQYAPLLRLYYSGAKAIILVYDITNKESFRKAAGRWLEEIKFHFSEKLDKPIIYLVGNKLDLEDQRAVKYSDRQKIIKKEAKLRYFETSAKSGINVEMMFFDIAVSLKKAKCKNEPPGGVIKPGDVEKLRKNPCC